MGSQGDWRNPRPPVDAYRASPGQQFAPSRDGQWHSGGGGGGSRVFSFSAHAQTGEPLHGPEIYGLELTAGLPGFEGCIATATLASGGPLTAASAEAAPQARYMALLCHEGLADFQLQHQWDAAVAPAVETALRVMAAHATPSTRELNMRLQAMARLKDLAQSGIHFCQGLDLEPYGSFVSGLYTPQGDLDLSIEGHATWRDEAGRVCRVTVDDMSRDSKVKFLRALASRIQAKLLCLGQVQRILHARVPILKFQDVSGLDFDVGIGGSGALFKSAVLGLLAQYDWRVGALVRLVKLWARRHDINDSANGSLNSFALTLLVVFHLQTRCPAVLPPLCDLFGVGPGDPRPMQEGAPPDFALLESACDRLAHLSRGGGPGGGNSEGLLELLASFFALYDGLLQGWAQPKGADAATLRGILRRVRVDTWAGRLRHEAWDREGYCMSVEDPFDSTDNCARTVRREDKLGQIWGAVQHGRQALLDLDEPHSVVERLVGPGVLHRDLRLDTSTPAVQWVRPVDLIIPPRIQVWVHPARIPPTVAVDHLRPRGGGGAAQQAQQVSQLAAELGHVALGTPVDSMAPPGLAPGVPVPGGRPLQQRRQQAATASLHELRGAFEADVAQEAARLAEIEAAAAKAAEKLAAARAERKEAKKAAQRAQQEAKRAERAGRSRSRGRLRSRSRGSRGSSRAASLGRAGLEASSSAAVSNLGRSSSLATTAGGSVATLGSLASSSCAVADSRGSIPLDDAAYTAAADELSASDDGAESVTQAARPAPVAQALAAVGISDGGGSGGSGGGRSRERRFGRNMKQGAQQRKARREGGEGSEAAASGPPLPSPPPPGLGQQRQQQQQQQGKSEAQQPSNGSSKRPRHKQRGGRGRGKPADGGPPNLPPPPGAGMRVLSVRRPKPAGGPSGSQA